MKKKKIVIISCIILILMYFGYKTFNLYYYNVSSIEGYDKFIEKINNTKTMNIKTTNLQEDEYLVHKNIKIKNEFENFKEIEKTEEYVKYALYEEDQIIASLWFGKSYNYVDMFKGAENVFSSNSRKINTENIEDFLIKHDISNDIKLLNFLKNNKTNIFSKISDIKNNYTVNLLSSIGIFVGEEMTMLEGDLEGYISSSKEAKEVNVYKNNKRYTFTFIKLDYFNEAKINELLKTIVID